MKQFTGFLSSRSEKYMMTLFTARGVLVTRRTAFRHFSLC